MYCLCKLRSIFYYILKYNNITFSLQSTSFMLKHENCTDPISTIEVIMLNNLNLLYNKFINNINSFFNIIISVDVKRNLHIMSDCIISMPISIGLEKNSPLKPRIDGFIQRIVEAGLVHKWLGDTMADTRRRHDSYQTEQVFG